MNKIGFLKEFKVLLLDADGVFFDGCEYRATLPDGGVLVLKSRHFHDGQALSLLRALGIRILFVSGEGEPLNSNVAKFNELPSCISGDWLPIDIMTRVSGQGKLEAIHTWLQANNLELSECTYIGDDLNDFVAMTAVKEAGGLVVAPANATRKIIAIADVVLEKSGGKGAIRKFVEMVLDAHGVDETTLALK